MSQSRLSFTGPSFLSLSKSRLCLLPTFLNMALSVLFVYLLAVFTSLAAGKPILMPRLAQDASKPSFDVTLESLGDSAVHAAVTNTGNEAVRLVRRGGILDHIPTNKVRVYHGGECPL